MDSPFSLYKIPFSSTNLYHKKVVLKPLQTLCTIWQLYPNLGERAILSGHNILRD